MTAIPPFNCPLCGGQQAIPIYSTLVQCTQCKLVCTAQPPDAALTELYDEGYFTTRNRYTTRSAVLDRMHAGLLDAIQRFQPSGNLVDIGCGAGQLMETAQQRGFAVCGCDVSPWATRYAESQGLNVITADLQGAAYPEARFNVAVVSHTLEHIPQPLPFLKEIRRILANAGVLGVEVPNFASLMSSLMRENWGGLLVDQHFWHFTPATLRFALEQAGFDVMVVTTDPYVHRHPNWVKDLALHSASTLGNALNRSDNLVAVARKA